MPKLKIPYKIRIMFETGNTLIMWLPFIFKDPRRLRFIPQWISSFLPGKAAFKDGTVWMPFEAREWLESFLKKNMNAFEWGSGGSTLFIAQRVKNLVSIEHNPDWYVKIGQLLKEKGFSNCRYFLKEPQAGGTDYFSSSKYYRGFSFEEYCKIIDSYPDNYFDLVLVDGRARTFCISHALKKIRPRGYLLLDDSDNTGYAPGKELLKDWERKNFFGPKPYVINFYHTTLWQKPVL